VTARPRCFWADAVEILLAVPDGYQDWRDNPPDMPWLVFVRFTPIQRPNLSYYLSDLMPILRVISVRFSPRCAGSVEEGRGSPDHCTPQGAESACRSANE
jgi:hypothetical protein